MLQKSKNAVIHDRVNIFFSRVKKEEKGRRIFRQGRKKQIRHAPPALIGNCVVNYFQIGRPGNGQRRPSGESWASASAPRVDGSKIKENLLFFFVLFSWSVNFFLLYLLP
jgi:hypothetical protein